MVREEIRYLNRSYNKKRTNRYGRVLFGKTSVSPNAGARGDKISQQEFQQRKRTTQTLDNERYHIPNVKDFGTSKNRGINEEARKETRREPNADRLFLYDGSTYER